MHLRVRVDAHPSPPVPAVASGLWRAPPQAVKGMVEDLQAQARTSTDSRAQRELQQQVARAQAELDRLQGKTVRLVWGGGGSGLMSRPICRALSLLPGVAAAVLSSSATPSPLFLV